MRGKLRDKHATSRHSSFRQKEVELRRPYKRDTRNNVLWDEDDSYNDDDALYDDEQEEESNTQSAL